MLASLACNHKPYQRLQDGLERTWAVNVAAPFILTNQIVDVINDRVVNVGTSAMADTIDFDNLQQVRNRRLQCVLFGLHFSVTTCVVQCFASEPGRFWGSTKSGLLIRVDTIYVHLQEKNYERNGHAAYSLSKVALTMWGLELANRLAHTPVSVVNVDPGTVDTKLLQIGWGNISHVAVKVEVSPSSFIVPLCFEA